MIQLKLNLNSDKPSTVYSLNGKSYRLVPGTNVLNLEYEDYVSLAKALSIVPVERPSEKKSEDNKIKQPEPTREEPKQEPLTEELVEEPSVKDAVDEPVEQAEESHVEEPAVEEQVEESNESDAVDYSTWSYTKLKAEYKRVTGNTCKLKKEEIITFLQENNSNV